MTTTTPTIRIKESAVAWRHLTVVTTRLPDPNHLRPYLVFVVANETGAAVSLTAQFANEAAADHEHAKLVHQLTTGTMCQR